MMSILIVQIKKTLKKQFYLSLGFKIFRNENKLNLKIYRIKDIERK